MKLNYRQSASFNKKLKGCLFSIYCKLSNQEITELNMPPYGDAGNVVHHTLEYYYKHLNNAELNFTDFSVALEQCKNVFDKEWDEVYNITSPKLNKDLYWLCVINGIKLDLEFTDLEFEYDHIVKYKHNGKENEVIIKGFADVRNEKEENVHIYDWKTATYKASKLRDFKEQLKFYAYLEYKHSGKLSKAGVYFNKVDKYFPLTFTKEEILSVEDGIIKNDIELKERWNKLDFPRTPSNSNCFFCNYKKVCASDLLRNTKSKKYEVTFHLKKDVLLVEGNIPDVIHRKIEKICNFEVKNAQFRIMAMAKRGIKYDGIKRLWRRRPLGGQCRIGFMHSIHRILKEYAHGKGQLLRLTIKDYRDQEVMNNKWDVFPDKLNSEFAFGTGNYSFQAEAVNALFKYRWGIVEVGTGGGKTAIAAECIRRLHTRTLFVIDNKDLLLQTKKEYETLLGISCGIVGIGERDWDKPIVLATIQTLEKHLKEYSSQLALFNLVIFDEVQITGAKSFTNLSKYLINTKYRFNFSATAKRDDLEDPVIYSVSGEVVYKKSAKELTNLGVLTKVKSIFYKYPKKKTMSENWQNEYIEQIVNNENRNDLIREITKRYVSEGKQIMILIKDIKNNHAHNLLETIPNSRLIYGKTKDKYREQDLEDFKNGLFQVLIGNIKIFNKGINIKNLDVIINAAANAGEVVTIQTIGRALRKHKNKKIAYYIDFFDNDGEYVRKHTMSRIDALKKENYDVEINEDFK